MLGAARSQSLKSVSYKTSHHQNFLCLRASRYEIIFVNPSEIWQALFFRVFDRLLSGMAIWRQISQLSDFTLRINDGTSYVAYWPYIVVASSSAMTL